MRSGLDRHTSKGIKVNYSGLIISIGIHDRIILWALKAFEWLNVPWLLGPRVKHRSDGGIVSDLRITMHYCVMQSSSSKIGYKVVRLHFVGVHMETY